MTPEDMIRSKVDTLTVEREVLFDEIRERMSRFDALEIIIKEFNEILEKSYQGGSSTITQVLGDVAEQYAEEEETLVIEDLHVVPSHLKIQEIGKKLSGNRGPQSNLIYGVVSTFKTDFTYADVIDCIPGKIPDKMTLRKAITSMIKDGIVEVVRPVVGQRHGIYRYKGAA